MSEILRLSDNVERNESHLSLHKIDSELMIVSQNQNDKETVAIYLNDFQIFTLLQHLTKFLVKDKKDRLAGKL